MKFYDAHIHFVSQCSEDDIGRIFTFLERIGLAGLDLLVFAEYPGEIATILKMIPEGYHNQIDLKSLTRQMDPFTLLNQFILLNQSSQLKIIPYLDARFMERDIEEKIKMYSNIGVKGLKLLYVPEEDKELKIGGMERAFGRPVKQSERITSLLIDIASAQGMTILFHVDLRKYGEFVREMLASHPRTNFNIAHFGFSRRSLAHLLDNYPNCYTDISSMTPFIKSELSSYLNFMKHYQNRILFGSDAMIDQPATVQNTIRFIIDFVDDPGLLKKMFRENYLAFHNFKEDP